MLWLTNGVDQSPELQRNWFLVQRSEIVGMQTLHLADV